MAVTASAILLEKLYKYYVAVVCVLHAVVRVDVRPVMPRGTPHTAIRYCMDTPSVPGGRNQPIDGQNPATGQCQEPTGKRPNQTIRGQWPSSYPTRSAPCPRDKPVSDYERFRNMSTWRMTNACETTQLNGAGSFGNQADLSLSDRPGQSAVSSPLAIS
jgi:hypothetical protein